MGAYEAETTLPTQVAHSTRAALRTFAQALPVLVAVALALPDILGVLAAAEVLPEAFRAWALGAAVTTSGLIGLVAKLVNLPTVNLLVEKYLRPLAAAPQD